MAREPGEGAHYCLAEPVDCSVRAALGEVNVHGATTLRRGYQQRCPCIEAHWFSEPCFSEPWFSEPWFGGPGRVA